MISNLTNEEELTITTHSFDHQLDPIHKYVIIYI